MAMKLYSLCRYGRECNELMHVHTLWTLKTDSIEELMGQDALPANKVQDTALQLNSFHLIMAIRCF